MNILERKTNNSLESSLRFGFSNTLSFESIEDLYRPHPEVLLEEYPNRLKMLKNALRKIKFKFNGKFIADRTMPMNVGGYFSPEANVLAINPMLLLYGSEKSIAHVLYHEGLHAGVYTNGKKIMEEVVVETMTKKAIGDIYGGLDFRSGYDNMVDEASEFFGELSYEQMTDQIEDGDESTFNNFLELIVVKPAINSGAPANLSWENIQSTLGDKWDMLKRLFPRMINSIADRNVGYHESAVMKAYQYKLEGLLEKCAERIISESKDLITEIFWKLSYEGKKIMNKDEMMDAMFKNGFGYLYDKEPELMEKYINSFLLQTSVNRFLGKEVKPSQISLNLV